MAKSNSPMKVFTPAWHESGCLETNAVKAYQDFWKEHEAQWPTAYRNCGLGWHDMEVEGIEFREATGGKEDMIICLAYRSPTSFFRDRLVFCNADVRKHNVDTGNIWLYSEVELLGDERYYIRIMFYAGGDKRRYIKVICDDVLQMEI